MNSFLKLSTVAIGILCFCMAQNLTEEMVNFRIMLPQAIIDRFGDGQTPTNVEEEVHSDKVNNMRAALGKCNKNLDLVQDGLYAVQNLVGIILAKGSTFQRDFITVQDQFKNQPSNLVELRRRVNVIEGHLDNFKGLVDELIEAGMETEQMKQATSALKDLKATVLEELMNSLQELPDENKISATGENLGPGQQLPGPLVPQQPPPEG